MEILWEDLGRRLHKPELYAPDGGSLWDDAHVSKGMLKAHLDPDYDAASRRPAFMDRSAGWISRLAPAADYPDLLDLGCGPGLYAERFARAGYRVTGMDFSRCAIAYAEEAAVKSGSGIRYLYQDYLTLNEADRFDLVTLIYCDYAALAKSDRHKLLHLIRRALKPHGKLIFDVFTPRMRSPVRTSWQYMPQGGFWSEKPHMVLNAVYQYADADQTELRRSVVCTGTDVRCFNVWDHFFTRDTLAAEVHTAGFTEYEFYGDAAGKEYDSSSETICAVLTK